MVGCAFVCELAPVLLEVTVPLAVGVTFVTSTVEAHAVQTCAPALALNCAELLSVLTKLASDKLNVPVDVIPVGSCPSDSVTLCWPPVAPTVAPFQ